MLTDEINRLISVIESSVDYPNYIDNSERVWKAIVQAITNDEHIVFDLDSDVDGVTSVLIGIDTLDAIGYRNYSVVPITEKRHGVDGATVNAVVTKEAKLLIVTDSSSDRMEFMNEMCNSLNGLKIIHIDHHLVTNNIQLHPNIISINSTTLKNFEYKDVSCGLLFYLLLKPVLDDLSPKLSRELESLAYASVITDVIPMSSDALINFMTVAQRNTVIHPLLTAFMHLSDEHKLSREFISFQFAPKINSVFRMNRLDILFDLLFIPRYKHVLGSYSLSELYRIYGESMQIRQSLTPIAIPERYGDFLFVDITEQANEKEISSFVARNFTGLIATEFSNVYKLPVICTIKQGDKLKGSGRDYFGRNLLFPVSSFVDAGGHKSAFGFSDSLRAMNRLKNACKNNTLELLEVYKKDVCIDMSNTIITSLSDFMLKIQTYSKVNELGTSVPNVFTEVALPFGATINSTKRYSSAHYKGIEFISFNGRIHPKMREVWKPLNNKLTR